jgi:hypothetical protein
MALMGAAAVAGGLLVAGLPTPGEAQGFYLDLGGHSPWRSGDDHSRRRSSGRRHSRRRSIDDHGRRRSNSEHGRRRSRAFREDWDDDVCVWTPFGVFCD